ncbi:MAG: S-layer family protein, partial [Azonexus sp.]|nr:S-layer family protein [Azonexus sp.]
MNTVAHALIYSPSRSCLIPAPESARRRSKQRRMRRNRLYHQQPGSTAHYLLETDPVFANYRTWLSSDYLLQALSLDPAQMQKRLGDGFYEQRLIAEQVAQLTGRRFLAGYADDETQYQALLAGEHYRQSGSDVLAPQGDIGIAAQAVDIVEAREASRTTV